MPGIRSVNPPLILRKDSRDYDPDGLVQALEEEDEALAVSMIRGAYAAGAGYGDLRPALARAALAHYQDLGHALIYVEKTGELIERLGSDDTALPLSLMLARSLVYASREDLIPEFKSYAPALKAWTGGGDLAPTPDELYFGRLATILERLSAGSSKPLATYDAAMEAAAWQMLHYDTSYQAHVDKPVSQNVGWLSFTHALTFGNAVRRTCQRQPELWPAGLLQLGCFLSRHAGFVDADQDATPWHVEDPKAFVSTKKAALIDHGEFEYIVACHHLKLTTAMAEEFSARADVPWAATAAAALHRFLNSPLKRKHALRTANQSLDFVRVDG